MPQICIDEYKLYNEIEILSAPYIDCMSAVFYRVTNFLPISAAWPSSTSCRIRDGGPFAISKTPQ
jgi:hypothetical protein